MGMVILVSCPARAETPMREISKGCFQIGEVRLDKGARTVSFDGEVNMKGGPIEYLLVTDGGKTHESLLTTRIDPSDLHVSMLLVGASDSGRVTAPPPMRVTGESLKKVAKLRGTNIDVLVCWTIGSAQQEMRVEDMILRNDGVVERGPWLYTGSVIYDGRFLARTEGSLISLITDPAALVNNPRPGADNDQIWSVRSSKVPAVGTAVEITLRLTGTSPR